MGGVVEDLRKLIIKIKIKKLVVESLLTTTQCTHLYTGHFKHLNKLFNFNFNYQHTTRCLECGEYIYKQLFLVRMHISLYYLLCNSAP
jgi:hypothetical protein